MQKPGEHGIETLKQRGWNLKSRGIEPLLKASNISTASLPGTIRALPNSTDGVTRGYTPTIGRHVSGQVTRFENSLKERIGSRCTRQLTSTADNGDG